MENEYSLGRLDGFKGMPRRTFADWQQQMAYNSGYDEGEKQAEEKDYRDERI